MAPSRTLLVLAAGLGSRYGGPKQVEPVGPHGEFIIDYSVYDALRAGFRKIVFVIRKELEEALAQTILARLPRDLEVCCAWQELDMLPEGFRVPPGRCKPWGTGHAIWAARECVGEPMLVINADDFYGAAAYQAAADYFALADASGTDYCMVGYRLRNTVSPHGPVARGICRADAEALLIEVVEVAGIQRDAAGEIQTTAADGRRQRFSGEEIVSMNMWGFTPAVFPQLERLLGEFLRDRGGLSAAEFYIPAAVAALVRSRAARVKVLDAAGAEWIGATYAQDKALVMDKIRGLIAAGVYPSPLWPAG
ncbi:MAG: NTP transferase domain-containing protein [Thermoguttaceae bacterium]